MKWITGVWLISILLCGLLMDLALGASLEVTLGETHVVTTGQVYDAAVVHNGGVLILDGGIIGTNAFPSITVEEGGRFVFNAGLIRYFENSGVTELYGGRQATDSSVNRGYLKLAGGDPGIQIIHNEGTLDVYYTATNRTAWEIDSPSTSTAPAIRFFSLTNSLSTGSYTYGTLTPASYYAFGKVYHSTGAFWAVGAPMVARIDISVWSNWQGRVWSYGYTAPVAFTSTVRTAVEIAWNAVSGRTYQVQYTTNLLANAWQNLGLPVQARSVTGSVCDTAYITNKTYRVLVRH
ncbi:MAG: hypothetical protein A2X46_07150 [Lentisphaerae bacterium GWF2_57_35]|nr:MAG: hypothetical protein A2X46_07150 [Lentisphaerae bacterium GWF2_57_35]